MGGIGVIIDLMSSFMIGFCMIVGNSVGGEVGI